MKKRHILLLLTILTSVLAAVLVSSGREDMRDRLDPYYTPEKWSLPDSVIGRDFSVFTTVIDTDFEPAPDAKFGYTGDRFGPMIFRFVREGDELVLQQAAMAGILSRQTIPKGTICTLSMPKGTNIWR